MDNSDGEVIYELRGQGMANIVIGFISGDRRMVWRIRKDCIRYLNTASNELSITDYSMEKESSTSGLSIKDVENQLEFMRNFILPLFDSKSRSKFIILPKIVEVKYDILYDIVYRCGIVSSIISERIANESTIHVLEMPDFTLFLPKEIATMKDDVDFPVIGVEMKPKQGFIPDDLIHLSQRIFNDEDVAYCTNCLSQFEKHWKNSKGKKLYDYCPLDLFSGNPYRMRKAIKSLIDSSSTHLRLTRNGKRLDTDKLSNEEIRNLFFGDYLDENSTGFDFIDCLIQVLLDTDHTTETGENGLPKGSVLNALLYAQKFDQLGPLKTSALIQELISSPDCADPFLLFFGDFSTFGDQIDLIRRGIICHTLRDCSIMITMQLFNIKTSGDTLDFSTYISRPIRISDRLRLRFNVSMVDLDAKSPRKLLNFAERLKSTLVLLHEEYTKNGFYPRIPCNMRDKF